MREIELPLRFQFVAVTQPYRTCRPFTHAIKTQDRRLIKGTGIKCRCGMRLVMLIEKNGGKLFLCNATMFSKCSPPLPPPKPYIHRPSPSANFECLTLSKPIDDSDLSAAKLIQTYSN